MDKKILTNAEIIEFLEQDMGSVGPTALGEQFDDSRQTIGNYSRRTKIDINNKVISYLIGRIRELKA
jgi:uncharacterized membrane protein